MAKTKTSKILDEKIFFRFDKGNDNDEFCKMYMTLNYSSIDNFTRDLI